MPNVSRTKTWVSDEILTASNLNAEFNAILAGINNNALDSDNLSTTAAYVFGDVTVTGLTVNGTIAVGVDDTGYDVKFFGAAAGAFGQWDESANKLILQGATAAGPGSLLLSTGELTNVNGGILGRIDFSAPLDSAGGDARLTGASIWAEADDTFSSSLNDTDLVFAVAESEAALERMRLSYDGTNVGLLFSGATTIGAGGALITFNGAITSDGAVTGATLAGTVSTAAQNSITSATSLASVGTITSGTWQGTAVASAYLDADTAHLGVTQTFTGAKTFTNTVTVGVDDAGHDVKLFGNAAGAYMEWDTSADQLRIMGASADAVTSTGKLLLATSLTNINANDVLGKIDFQAPHEAGGTDAITIAASIQAIAQGTFAADLNATDLIFYTGHSEAATEKFRMTSQGEIGVGGANYGTDGQVLTSGGAGAAVAWEALPTSSSAFSADVTVANGYGLVVGGTAQQEISDGDGSTAVVPEAQILGTAAADTTLLIGGWSETATRAAAPTLALLKSGHATIGTHTVVTDDEILGSVIAYGDTGDGQDYRSPAAAIEFAVDGTPGAGDMPGRIVMYTTPDGGETLTEAMRIDNQGAVTKPLTPCVYARSGAAQTNITGDGTQFTLLYATEITDQGGDFVGSTGIFTAPVTGTYFIAHGVQMTGVVSGHNYLAGAVVASNRTFETILMNAFAIVGGGGNPLTYSHASLIDMDAADTVYTRFQVNNGTKVIDMADNETQHISIYLVA